MCDLELDGSNLNIALHTLCHYGDHLCPVILETF
jgi:hypothetical protein